MPLITHHTDDIIHMDTVAICGSQFWRHITTGWGSVTCPACLKLRPTKREPDDGDAPVETELSNDELDTDYQLWSNT
jgi:hypothetical protein